MHVHGLPPELRVFFQSFEANPTPGSKKAALHEPRPIPATGSSPEVLQGVLTTLGLTQGEELQKVGYDQCRSCCADDWAATILWALVLSHRVHCPPPVDPCALPPRCEPLPQLDVEAYAGDFRAPAAPPAGPDPLVLIFSGLEPSTKNAPTQLFLINRSRPNAQPIALPGDTMKAVDGRYSLILDAAWMQKNGVRPGDVLALYQEKHQGGELRRSEPTVVPINPVPSRGDATPALPPGDVIGDVQVRERLVRYPDVHAAELQLDRLAARLAGGQLTFTSNDGIEPFARVRIRNLNHPNEVKFGTVGADGQLALSIAAQANDPLIIDVADHSHDFGTNTEEFYTRTLSLTAGRDLHPIFAFNSFQPTQADGDPRPFFSLGQSKLKLSGPPGNRKGTLVVDKGLTPGTILTLQRAGQPQLIRAVADKTGSVSVELPFLPRAGDVLEVKLENPCAYLPSERSKEMYQSAVQLEIQGNGGLQRVKHEGRVSEGAEPVKPARSVDPLFAPRDLVAELAGKLGTLELISDSYNRRTGSGTRFGIQAARPGEYRAQYSFDPQANELKVVIGLASTVYRPNELAAAWAGTNGNFFHDADPVAGAIAATLHSGKDGALPKVHFLTEDGQTIAKGELTLTVERRDRNQTVTTGRLLAENVRYV